MKVRLQTASEQLIVDVAQMQQLTEAEAFQMFLNHFKNSGWYQVSSTLILPFHVVQKFILLKEEV